MSRGHGKDAARSSQAKPGDDSEKEQRPFGIRVPRLVVGGIYSTDDLINNLDVSKNTITNWVRDGLPSFSRGTKTQFFLADDLISYWRDANEKSRKA